ncbi:uncharacterized protein LOC112528330 [Cynara cardunculus var. scolymus]|uniref:uncharacterized protein LOC112528330 n=1 Tax=Cynara cardunculus var. scolymus TaxID=59895 RepID=UPI000D629ECE|nr:uncharacterized protein LOC112528330 [Cynara cardunculus var. scolymus]
MAPPHNQPNHILPSLPFSLSTHHRRRRCSKAQMCFFNILHIISVFPAADVTDKKCFGHDEEICENKVFGDDDININLRPPTEVEPFETLATADDFAENCVQEMNDRRKNESFVAEESELAVEEERATEHSEISHVGDQSSGIDYNGVSEVVEEEKQRDEGYLGLLIEAAQLILGEDSEKAKKPPKSKHVEASSAARRGAKRKQQCWTAAAEAEWYAEFEDTSPVVKSKRGRSQVLPYKYRDSVVEPLVGWTSSSHRSIANSAAVPSKRRSK